MPDPSLVLGDRERRAIRLQMAAMVILGCVFVATFLYGLEQTYPGSIEYSLKHETSAPWVILPALLAGPSFLLNWFWRKVSRENELLQTKARLDAEKEDLRIQSIEQLRTLSDERKHLASQREGLEKEEERLRNERQQLEEDERSQAAKAARQRAQAQTAVKEAEASVEAAKKQAAGLKGEAEQEEARLRDLRKLTGSEIVRRIMEG